MTVVAGVDACRGGWVAIVVEDGQFADSVIAATFAQLLETVRRRLQPVAAGKW